MIRRKFLKGAVATGAAAASAAASSFPAPAIAQGIKELKIVTSWPKNLPGPGISVERLAKRIEEATGGKLKPKVFAAGELVGGFEVLDAVSRGTADMGHGAAYYWQGKSKAFNFFTAVPMGLIGQEHIAWLANGGGQKLYEELCAQYNVIAYYGGHTDAQMGGWFRKEIKSLDDVKGLKYRIPGLGGEVMKRLGATVVNLPGGEVFAALQSGAIDGSEWVGPFADTPLGFYKVAKYYYYPGFHEPSTGLETCFNLDVWKGFSKEQQHVLRALVESEGLALQSDYIAYNGPALENLVDKHKVELRRFSDDLLKEFGRVSGEVVAEVGNSDPFTKKVYDSFMDFRKKSIEATKLSTHAYLNARALPYKYG
ncbi:MAG: TRAP transporter substrate-binding protein [Alphaproteobacteria bacterium]|nr:TRAP transporter substrate-binding protein [Alphaproteobacteria bacterium]